MLSLKQVLNYWRDVLLWDPEVLHSQHKSDLELQSEPVSSSSHTHNYFHSYKF